LPITSPTVRADFFGLAPAASPSSLIAYTIRRCTGFRPSPMKGSARSSTTYIE
jgi:hypothetical protein